MPENLRTIRRKIRTVTNIAQITRAMKMVAAARLQRVQTRVQAGKVYAERLQQLLTEVAVGVGEGFSHPYLEERPEPQSIGLLLVAGDKGLCAGHNANILREAAAFLQGQTAPVQVVTVANKARLFAQTQGLEVVASFEAIGGVDATKEATVVASACRSLYETGRVEALWIVYTRFVSAVRHIPTARQVLPITRPAGEDTPRREYIFEPPADQLLAQLLPQAVESEICQILMEAEASEQAARMIAMTAATDNAEDMIERLTRQLNRARQQAITSEILDIVGGAEALMGA